MNPHRNTPPTATAAIAQFAATTLHPRDYLEQCLAAIDAHDAEIGAFAHVGDREALLNACDAAAGHGSMAGIPIGVKDVIDTESLPTEFNSPLYRGRLAGRDAACVSVLRAHGGFVLGKTATVEFASLGRVPDTRNPHHPGHTPGGTSSGSAAAVAAGMVPLALGTQTGGSTIRPASFCGVAAFKPTWGLVPTEGLKPYAPSLDTITWMARSVDDLDLVLRCFRSDKAAVPPPRLNVGFYRTPYWERAEPATRDALERAVELLEAAAHSVHLIPVVDEEADLNTAQDTIMHGEGRSSYLAEYLRWPARLHARLRDEVENVRGIGGDELTRACDYIGKMRPRMEARMSDYDAWLVPAVPGEAPAGLDDTGDAVFNRLWTGLHFPAVTLPGFRGPQGLPVGIQLVAPRFRDARLRAVARVVEALISAA